MSSENRYDRYSDSVTYDELYELFLIAFVVADKSELLNLEKSFLFISFSGTGDSISENEAALNRYSNYLVYECSILIKSNKFEKNLIDWINSDKLEYIRRNLEIF